jgi:HAE1 family hydrophobic/amphiphilic exporter-1
VRHQEAGEDPRKAALEGSRQIGFTVISMTLSLAAVFLPVYFMKGLVGRLLHEFATTIGVAILISGFISLSLTPMLASRFLRPSRQERHGRLYLLFEQFFAAVTRVYDRSLQVVLRHRLATLLLSFVILAATVYLFAVIPKGFLPSEDTGSIFAYTEAAEGISFDSMVEHQERVAQIVAADPNVASFSSSLGAGGNSILATNSGRVFIRLKPRSQRSVSADEMIQLLRPKLAEIPGINVYLQNPPVIRIGGMLTKSLYQFTLQAPDTESLYEAAPRLEARLKELPQLRDVTSDLQIKNPQVDVTIDRDRAAALGLDARHVEDSLFSAYASRQVSTIFAPNNEYKVILELDPRYRDDPTALSMLYLRSPGGDLVPFDVVTRLEPSKGPLTVNHLGQLPAVTLSFNLSEGVSLSQAVSLVTQVARETLPGEISTSFQGTAQAFEASLRGLGTLLVMSIIVIYLVLGVLYESFVHPLTILSGLPSAGLGALLTLTLFHVDLNLYSFVGIIMLVGIVKKNAIMMIDFAIEAERKGGLTPSEAIYRGCLVRFRPIMMTTMAALMGTLPIAIGAGAGAESRRPLGLAVVGGLLVSQLITLYITPVYYTYLDSLQGWIMKRLPARWSAD